jgi:2-oxo-4-hydroxy-4-carboxy-5-ureidoimidazoline decarboxylase
MSRVIAGKSYSREAFIKCFADLYEHSSWVAENAFNLVFMKFPSGELPAIDKLDAVFQSAIMNADHAMQIKLLNEHPELACAVADSEQLTADSQKEQFKAGLQACSPEEFEEFRRLNQTYKKQFGFPFIVAVSGMKRAEILELFRARLDRNSPEEFKEALKQVCRIGRLRLESKFND